MQKCSNDKMMDRLQINPDINSRIIYTKVNPNDKGCVSLYIVCSSSITIADEWYLDSKLTCRNKNTDVALLLRGSLTHVFNLRTHIIEGGLLETL